MSLSDKIGGLPNLGLFATDHVSLNFSHTFCTVAAGTLRNSIDNCYKKSGKMTIITRNLSNAVISLPKVDNSLFEVH